MYIFACCFFDMPIASTFLDISKKIAENIVSPTSIATSRNVRCFLMDHASGFPDTAIHSAPNATSCLLTSLFSNCLTFCLWKETLPRQRITHWGFTEYIFRLRSGHHQLLFEQNLVWHAIYFWRMNWPRSQLVFQMVSSLLYKRRTQDKPRKKFELQKWRLSIDTLRQSR